MAQSIFSGFTHENRMVIPITPSEAGLLTLPVPAPRCRRIDWPGAMGAKRTGTGNTMMGQRSIVKHLTKNPVKPFSGRWWPHIPVLVGQKKFNCWMWMKTTLDSGSCRFVFPSIFGKIPPNLPEISEPTLRVEDSVPARNEDGNVVSRHPHHPPSFMTSCNNGTPFWNTL